MGATNISMAVTNAAERPTDTPELLCHSATEITAEARRRQETVA